VFTHFNVIRCKLTKSIEVRELPPKDSLGSVLEAFKKALKSVDVRTVAVKPNSEPWKNLITVISISEKTVSQIQIEQKKIPSINNNEFAIFFLALPFEYSIFEQIKQGQVIFKTSSGDFEVKMKGVDLLAKKATSGFYRANFVNMIVSEGDIEERTRLWSIMNNQQREIKRQNYRDAYELLKNVLRTEDLNFQQKDFEISIPSFARIDHASFKKNSFEVRIKKPSNLSGLQLNLSLKSRNTHPADILWSKMKKVDKNKFIFQPTDMVPFDSMEIELIHRDSALVLDSASVVVPVTNVIDPLLRTLNGFLPLEDFKRMLLEPQLCGTKPQEIFENAVAWLLSMAGFVTIHLGIKVKVIKGICQQTDILKLEDGYQVGEADIIAYKVSETLYLIDCDLKGNDTKKIQDLIELQKHFQSFFKEYKQLRIVPVLCSPKDLNEISHEGLVLFSNYRIHQMFEDVMRGDLEKARSTLKWLI